MDETRAAIIAEIEAWMERHDLDEDALDDLVHEAKSYEASEVNNGGWSKQIAYLLPDDYTAEDFIKDCLGDAEEGK